MLTLIFFWPFYTKKLPMMGDFSLLLSYNMIGCWWCNTLPYTSEVKRSVSRAWYFGIHVYTGDVIRSFSDPVVVVISWWNVFDRNISKIHWYEIYPGMITLISGKIATKWMFLLLLFRYNGGMILTVFMPVHIILCYEKLLEDLEEFLVGYFRQILHLQDCMGSPLLQGWSWGGIMKSYMHIVVDVVGVGIVVVEIPSSLISQV